MWVKIGVILSVIVSLVLLIHALDSRQEDASVPVSVPHVGDTRYTPTSLEGPNISFEYQDLSRINEDDPGIITIPEAVDLASLKPQEASDGAMRRFNGVFVDKTRTTPDRGAGIQDSRSMKVSVTWRSSGTKAPVLIFAHGYGINVAAYQNLLNNLSRRGLVVIGVDFPGSSTAYPGPASNSDIADQALDMSFVLDQLQNTRFNDVIDWDKIMVMGHSNGAISAAYMAASSIGDPRIKAAILGSGAIPRDRGPFWKNPMPVLVIHGDTDTTNSYSNGVALARWCGKNTTMATVKGGNHLDSFIKEPFERNVEETIIGFTNQVFGLSWPVEPAGLVELSHV